MKKLSLLRRVLLVVLASVLLASCGASSGDETALPKLDPADPVSLEIWHYYNGVQKTAFDQLVTEFNDTVGLKQGIVVEAFSHGNINDLVSNVMDAANKKVGAGEIPDIFAAYADAAFALDQLGLVAELDAYFTPEELAQYREEYVEEGRFDAAGSLKIFPTAKAVELMMVNLTDWEKFASATGAQLDQLSTIEGVVETAQKYYEWTDSLTAEPGDGKAFFGRDAMANYMIIGCRQLGVEIFSVEGGEAVFHVEKDVIRTLWDNYYVPFIKGYFAAGKGFRSDDAKTGDIIALVGSSTGAAYFPSKVNLSDTESYNIECWMAPAPTFAKGEKFAVQQGAGMVVTKSDKKTEYAAALFLKWFTEEERNIRFAASSSYLPVKNAANDADKILEILRQESDNRLTPNLEKAFPAAIEEVDTHKMYTSKAFAGSNDARSVLEHALSDQAAADRELVLERLGDGMTMEEAAADLVADQHFDDWFRSFESKLAQQLDTGAAG